MNDKPKYSVERIGRHDGLTISALEYASYEDARSSYFSTPTTDAWLALIETRNGRITILAMR